MSKVVHYETGMSHMKQPVDVLNLIARAYAVDPERTESELMALSYAGGITMSARAVSDVLTHVKTFYQTARGKNDEGRSRG